MRAAWPRVQRASSQGLTVVWVTTRPPARSTAFASPSGALARCSSRANSASVVWGGIDASAGASEEELKQLCRVAPNVKAHVDGREIVKEIVVPGKLVNLVVR